VHYISLCTYVTFAFRKWLSIHMETKYSDRFNPNILLKMIEYMYIQCANITSYTNFLPNCLSPTFCNSYDSYNSATSVHFYLTFQRCQVYFEVCIRKSTKCYWIKKHIEPLSHSPHSKYNLAIQLFYIHRTI